MESKIKQDTIHIGKNIRRIRKEKGIGQTELVQMLQLNGIMIYRESLVKIERGAQHITASQLKDQELIRLASEENDIPYEELLKEDNAKT